MSPRAAWETAKESAAAICEQLKRWGDNTPGTGNTKAWARAAESLAHQIRSMRPPEDLPADPRDEEITKLRGLLQEFCDRVERGEVRSVRTYAKVKEALASSTSPDATAPAHNQEINRLTHHRDLLAKALGDLLQAAGLVRSDEPVFLTGPELIAIAEAATEHFKKQPPAAPAAQKRVPVKVVDSGTDEYAYAWVLCNDGTMFFYDHEDKEYNELPPIPQPGVAKECAA
jgi:hypothetical protein